MVTTSKVHDALLDQPLSISLLLNDGSRLVTGQKFVYRPDPTFTSIEPLNHLITYVTRSSAIAVIADRTACSILTLFIAIATSRPLNKKNPFAVSPRIQQLLRICVRNPQSAHLCYTCRLQSHRSRHRVIVDKLAVPFR